MNEKYPLVSIVMPSFNTANFIEEAILSVLNQDYPNVELIIIDGGSTDGSIEIIKKHSSRLGYWISESDKGAVDAINKGLAKCNGEYIGILLSDDCYYLDSISRNVRLLNSKPEIDFVFGDTEQVDKQGNRLFLRMGNNLPFQQWVRTCTMPIAIHASVWRRSLLGRIGTFRISMGVATDWDFFLRVGLTSKIEYLPGLGGKFRYYSGTQSEKKQLDWVTLVPQMYKDLFTHPLITKELLKIKNESMSCANMYSAELLIEASLFKSAFKKLMLAFWTYPKVCISSRFIKLTIKLLLGKQSKHASNFVKNILGEK